MQEMWNKRYADNESVYGQLPNEFFEEFLNSSKRTGSILLPAEGEGRNAVFAAKKGWSVTAFDFSEVAKEKALAFATKSNVKIEYSLHDYETSTYEPESFDLIALIYSHPEPKSRESFYQKIYLWLKTGGQIILEGFSTDQLKYNSGGPKDINLLFNEDQMRDELQMFEIQLLTTLQIELKEGDYHKGNASVVRLIGTKK